MDGERETNQTVYRGELAALAGKPHVTLEDIRQLKVYARLAGIGSEQHRRLAVETGIDPASLIDEHDWPFERWLEDQSRHLPVSTGALATPPAENQAIWKRRLPDPATRWMNTLGYLVFLLLPFGILLIVSAF